MKKHVFQIVGILLITWVITAGFLFSENQKIPYEKRNIKVEDFQSVGVALSAKVYIEQASRCNLEIEAAPEVFDKIEIEVKNGKLSLRPENNISNLKGDITIWISAPDYESIGIAGSAEVLAESSVKLSDVTLKIAGSGTMNFEDLSSKELEIKIAGSGKMVIAGEGGKEMEVSIAGSGDLDATGFKVDEFEGKISGSGDCRVYVTGELSSSIAGSGSVYYKGNPEVNSSIAGSGKVKSLE